MDKGCNRNITALFYLRRLFFPFDAVIKDVIACSYNGHKDLQIPQRRKIGYDKYIDKTYINYNEMEEKTNKKSRTKAGQKVSAEYGCCQGFDMKRFYR